jgi:GNAT superfamily N-acetyltransferase
LAERGSELVGVYRLAREQGVLVLRGMRVLQSGQRQGVGTRLLSHLRELTEPCYCVPHAHLESFYGQAGFAALREEAAPKFLVSRAAEYRAQGLNVFIMRREPGSVSHRADHSRESR